MQLSKSLTIIGFTLALSGLVSGASPKLINFQGMLKKPGGQPVADSTYAVAFKIYDAPGGGSLLWSETLPVTTTGGLFTVFLGTTTPVPDSAFNDTGRYLGITIPPDPEMTPREELVSIPYGYRVNSVDGALGGRILTKVAIGPGQTNSGSNAFVTGSDNTASGDSSTVGGGSRNTASNTSATVAGGYANLAGGQFSAVGGGRSDTAASIGSVVNGGSYNTASSEHGVVGGGYANQAAGPWNTTVGGGSYNVASGNHATIGGGKGNRASGWFSVVGGGGSDAAGDSNTASAFWSTVGGGLGNKATGQAGTIAGGGGNTTSGFEAAIGGGKSNVASNTWATVAGGHGDTASGMAATIAGGDKNRASGDWAAIGGGQGDTASGLYSVVGGGNHNRASGDSSTIGGGTRNTASGTNTTVSGGRSNTAGVGNGAFVGGGVANRAAAQAATVAGGQSDTASGLGATVGGGSGNVASNGNATVAGGQINVASGLNSAVGGGYINTAGGSYSTVPGGFLNAAAGSYSFAAGRKAKANHVGSFVWADSSVDADFTSTAANQFLIRAAGGVGIGTNSPAARLHVDSGDVFVGNVTTATSPGTNLYLGDVGSDPNNTFRMDAFNNDFYMVARSGVGAAAGTSIRFRTATAGAGELDRMRITAAGNVGIGTTAPTSLLSVNGAASNTTGVWAIFSDRRLKRDIEPIDGALETVARLRGVSFRWRDAEKDAQFGRVRGLIAQDVEEVLPEWVRTDSDGYKRLEPIGVDALLIEAIKTLKTENAGLQDRIAKLESTVNALLVKNEETQASKSVGDRITGGR